MEAKVGVKMEWSGVEWSGVEWKRGVGSRRESVPMRARTRAKEGSHLFMCIRADTHAHTAYHLIDDDAESPVVDRYAVAFLADHLRVGIKWVSVGGRYSTLQYAVYYAIPNQTCINLHPQMMCIVAAVPQAPCTQASRTQSCAATYSSASCARPGRSL